MVRSVCAHVERFKQQGGIRDYEKILLNLCIACPQHLKMKREQQGIKVSIVNNGQFSINKNSLLISSFSFYRL